MKSTLFAVVALVGGMVYGQEAATASGKAHITAQFGDSLSSQDYRQLFIYSKEPLTRVEYRVGKAENWDSMAKSQDRDGYSIYNTSSYQNSVAGQTFRIRAVTKDSIQFVDQLVVAEVDGKKVLQVAGESEAKYTAPAVVVANSVAPGQQTTAARGGWDNATIFRGSAHISPQELAQARAEYMARVNCQGHLDANGGCVSMLWGSLQTSSGNLSEGVGYGSNPTTCVATNGSGALGDYTATGANGTQYRVRLYNSPGTYSPNSGSGWGGRRRGR